jgi:hypothetical protein
MCISDPRHCNSGRPTKPGYQSADHLSYAGKRFEQLIHFYCDIHLY